MITATAARHTILSSKLVVVYFIKRDGSERRMVCRMADPNDPRTFSRNPDMMRVWDVEKGALRTVNLQTVLSIKAMGKRHQSGTKAAPAPKPERDLRAMAAMFDNRAR